jgi:hypothetical protein
MEWRSAEEKNDKVSGGPTTGNTCCGEGRGKGEQGISGMLTDKASWRGLVHGLEEGGGGGTEER